MDDPRRQALYDAKLRALARDHWGAPGDAVVGTFPGGSTLRAGDRGWVLAEERGERALGGALAWARQAGVAELHVLAGEAAAGVLARRATAFSPPPSVWVAEGRDVAPARPAPFAAEAPPVPGSERFVALFQEAGAEVVVEHGVLRAEVLGLEVGRVVAGSDGEPALEVGVGKLDREAQKLVHADRQPAEALHAAVAHVRAVRNAAARPHPMNQLAADRWLRVVVCANPGLVGAAAMAPVPATLPRGDLRERASAPALGRTAAGQAVMAVCSTGIDVDLVPAAADARLAHAAGARLVLVVPEPDAHPVTVALAGALADPAEVVTVPREWRSLTPAEPRP